MKYLYLSALLLSTNFIIAQDFFVDFSVPPDEMVIDFFQNDSVTISNVEIQSVGYNMAFFDRGNTDFPIGAGIVLTTGEAQNIPMPFGYFASTNIGLDGDEDIDIAGMSQSFDAATIEFDLVPSGTQMLDFQYVFASEEYPEFVNSQFNDAFLFLISGPGLAGTYSNNSFNAAMIPDTNIPVSINTVNEFSNPEYYNLNLGEMEFMYDGYTEALPAEFYVIEGETYHVKIVVGDVGDGVFDSAIFLGYNSLGNSDSLVPPTDFELSAFSDEVMIDNASKYATQYTWDFGNGEISHEKHPVEVDYETPGMYTVSLTTSNYCCTSTYTSEVEITSVALTMETNVLNNVHCFGDNSGAVELTIAGGVGENYSITAVPEILDYYAIKAGTYVVTVEDEAGSFVTDSFTIIEPPLLEAESSAEDSDFGLNNGTATISIQGGVEPYNVEWTNGDSTFTIVDLEPGTYFYVITDANECVIEGEVEIGVIYAAMSSTLEVLSNVSCFNGNDGSISFDVQGGNAPYTIEFSPDVADLNSISAGDYTVTATDQDGSSIQNSFSITQPMELLQSGVTEATTEGLSTGSISIDITGGTEPYSILWSTGETTSFIENLAAGTYTVEITDAKNCIIDSTYNVGSVVSIFESEVADFGLNPNPATDQVIVKDFSGEVARAYALDMNGKKIALPFTSLSNEISIDVSQFANGIYLIQLLDKNGDSQSARLIKQ